MKMQVFIMAFFIVGFTGNKLHAQNLEKIESKKEERSFTRIGIRYANDYVYNGRTDSLQAPYLTPSIGYYHSSGFFVDGSFSYLTSSEEKRVDLYTISGGYDYLGKQLSVGISLSSYFFNDKSYTVQSTMSGFLNSYVGYDFVVFEMYADGSMGISEGVDLFAGLEVRRTFYAIGDRLRIIPSAYINAGSQNYYNEYYSTRNSIVTKGSAYGRGAGKGPGANSSVNTDLIVKVDEVTKFKILDYELSLMFIYKVDDFRFSLKPVYAFPVNPATVTVDETLVFNESLDNIFFWSAGVSYTF